MLTDIAFDGNDMVLGFRDRFGDQSGAQSGDLTRLPAPRNDNVGDPDTFIGINAGDILRACWDGTNWNLENNGSCGTLTSAIIDNGKGPGGDEFYSQDGQQRTDSTGIGPADYWHDELALGGLTQIPGQTRVASTFTNPVYVSDSSFFTANGNAQALYDGGVRWFNNTTGSLEQIYRIYDEDTSGTSQPTTGKANGLGDLEVLCGAAPLEIGNLVWHDLNLNGRQDPDEPFFGNVLLSLYLDTNNDGTTDTLVA